MNDHIPIYGLYGEPRDSATELGIHVEDIAHRSRGQNWRIRAHRHGKLFQILCVFNGNATIQLDDREHRIGKWSLVTIPVGTVHSFSFRPDSEGVVITLSEQTITEIFAVQNTAYLRPVFENAAVIDMASCDEQRIQCQSYLDLIRYEFSAANDAKFSSLLMLISLFLINIKRQFDLRDRESNALTSPLKTIDAFRRLVEEHFKEHWKVSHYARALGVSTSTLNRMCKENFGINAKAIILNRVTLEAKRRLIYTQQPLDQVGYYLGFKDPAYFSRLFKKKEGVSPRDYRKAHQL